MIPNQAQIKKLFALPIFWVMLASIAVLFYGMSVFPLTDPSEARYAEIARKMLETGDWITPQFDYGIPFWAKPPLSTWFAALSMRLFGVSEFAARLPSFLLGVITVLLTVTFTRDYLKTSAQQMLVLVLTTMSMFYVCAAAVMTDATLVFVCTLTLVAFWNAVDPEANNLTAKRWAYIFFAALGLGLLAKGPAAWVLSLLPIFIWLFWAKRWLAMWKSLPWVSGTLLTAAISFPWYILAERKTPGFLEYFIVGEHIKRFLIPSWAGDLYGHAHQEPMGTIWVFLGADAFPWVFVVAAVLIYSLFKRRFNNPNIIIDSKTKYVLCWFFAQMLFFTIAKNIIPTYTLTALPAFAILTVKLLQPYAIDGQKIKNWVYACGLLTPILLMVIIELHKYYPDITQGSAKQISLVYQQENNYAPTPMLYVGKRIYSMEFYNHGEIARFSSLQKAINFGKQNKIYLLVIADASLPGLPPKLVHSLELIKTVPRYGIYKISHAD